jgi:hypothetical protein
LKAANDMNIITSFTVQDTRTGSPEIQYELAVCFEKSASRNSFSKARGGGWALGWGGGVGVGSWGGGVGGGRRGGWQC